jgi:hypothetical protein
MIFCEIVSQKGMQKGIVIAGDIGSMKWNTEFAPRVWRSYVCLGFLFFASGRLADWQTGRLADLLIFAKKDFLCGQK